MAEEIQESDHGFTNHAVNSPRKIPVSYSTISRTIQLTEFESPPMGRQPSRSSKRHQIRLQDEVRGGVPNSLRISASFWGKVRLFPCLLLLHEASRDQLSVHIPIVKLSCGPPNSNYKLLAETDPTHSVFLKSLAARKRQSSSLNILDTSRAEHKVFLIKDNHALPLIRRRQSSLWLVLHGWRWTAESYADQEADSVGPVTWWLRPKPNVNHQLNHFN